MLICIQLGCASMTEESTRADSKSALKYSESEWLTMAERQDLCASNQEMIALADRFILIEGRFSLVTGVVGILTDPSCGKQRRLEVVTSFYTLGDQSVDDFYDRIAEVCGPSSGPCSVEADVKLIAQVRLYEGRPLLEFKHIFDARFLDKK